MQRERIETLLKEVTVGLYEKETDVALSLLAALSGESIIMLGPPGTAKSMAARRLSRAFKDAKGFEYLMSRFSTPDEIFGPVSISLLKTSDRYERVVEGYLPSADVVFLDEIWKAGPAIQNTLLTVINEKVFRNGDKEIRLPLKLLVAASNELPAKGEGLEALWDRFVIRLESRAIIQERNFRRMLDDNCDDSPCPSHPITREEYVQWSQDIRSVNIPEGVYHCIFSLRRSLQAVKIDDDEYRSVYVSDRRWKNIARLLRTAAFMHDRREVVKTDLLFVYHCLWQEPEERNPVRDLLVHCVFEEETSVLSGLKARLAEDIRNHSYNVRSSVTTDYPREIDALAEQVAAMEKTVADCLLLSSEEKKHISAYLKDIYKSMAFLRQDLLKLES